MRDTLFFDLDRSRGAARKRQALNNLKEISVVYFLFPSLQPRCYGAVSSFVLMGLLAVGGQAVRAEGARVHHSPDGRLAVQIQMPVPGSADTPHWSAAFNGKTILSNCRLSLNIAGEGDLLAGVQVQEERSRSLDKRVRVLFGKTEVAHDNYHETALYARKPPSSARGGGIPLLQ